MKSIKHISYTITIIKILLILFIIVVMCSKSYGQYSYHNKELNHSLSINGTFGQFQNQNTYGIELTSYHLYKRGINPTIKFNLFEDDEFNILIGFTQPSFNSDKGNSSFTLDAGVYLASKTIDNYNFYIGNLQYGIYVYGNMSYYMYNNLPLSFSLGITGLNRIQVSYLIKVGIKL